MSLSPAFLDELRARTSLSALIGRSVKLQRAGREYKACCPFHNEKTPSFTVNDEKGFYHCFGCGAHGDAIRFLTENRGLSFMDAVKELADAAGMKVPAPDPRAQERAERAKDLYDVMQAASDWFEEQLGGLDGADARAYLEKRGIADSTRRRFNLGFAPDSRAKLKTALRDFGVPKLIEAGLLVESEEKEPYDRFRGRLIIPIRDQRGRVIAFGGRTLGAGEPKYLNSPETPLFDKGRTLYNLDRAGPASRSANRVIVVEGYMDVIALDQAGIGEAVAPLGTALTEGQLERLWRLSDAPILCLDGDAAGQKAAVRAAERALPHLGPNRTIKFARLPTGLDPDDIVKDGGAPALNVLLGLANALDELLWQTEYRASDLTTPEGRASLGRRLRDHARRILDDDTRTAYLATFKQRHHALFSPPEGQRPWNTAAGRWLQTKKHVPQELLDIRQYGTAKTLFAPAALKGLCRFPALLSSHAEIVGGLAGLLLHKDLRQICQEMLDAALTHYPLESEQLELILRQAGLAEVLNRFEKRQRVPFSFLRSGASEEQAKRDLASVLENLAAEPEVQASLDHATKRAKELIDEASFAEQVRLQIVQQMMKAEFADFLQNQAEQMRETN